MAGTIIADTWQNGDGTQNYKCRAWVNFNGTGTVAIRASGNVSSITDRGVGLYTVNLSTAMPDINYAVTFGIQNNTNGTYTDPSENGTRSVSSLPMQVLLAGSMADPLTVQVAVFR